MALSAKYSLILPWNKAAFPREGHIIMVIFVHLSLILLATGTEGNFRKLIEGIEVDLLNTRYDYTSVMHYGAYGFAVDRKVPTIIPKVQGVTIGQRSGMSAIDIERVQILYGCKRAVSKIILYLFIPK